MRLIRIFAISALLVGSTSVYAQPLTPQGWTLTPAGRQVSLGDRPLSIASSPDGRTLLVGNDGQSTESLMVIDRTTGTVRQTIAYPSPEALFVGLVFGPDGKHAYASAGGNNRIRVYDVADQQLTESNPIALPTPDKDGKKSNPYPAGIAIRPTGPHCLSRTTWTIQYPLWTLLAALSSPRLAWATTRMV
jgi:DNA-binding beta-propeller fold protein YncE